MPGSRTSRRVSKVNQFRLFSNHRYISTLKLHLFIDKQFLVFFFKRLGKNDTDRYPEFPYLSRCGRERNYIKCDDYPVVFTHTSVVNEKDVFCHNHAGDLLYEPFEPHKIYMHVENGRIYHPCSVKMGSIGLVASKLAIEFSKSFTFDENGIPCLLYTSPSPRDRTRSRMPSSA